MIRMDYYNLRKNTVGIKIGVENLKKHMNTNLSSLSGNIYKANPTTINLHWLDASFIGFPF